MKQTFTVTNNLLSVLLLAMIALIPCKAKAASSGWYLYVWDYATNAEATSSARQFQNTDKPNVFVVEALVISPAQASGGLGISVYDNGWSNYYGYTTTASASVTSVGTEVELGAQGSAKWCQLPAGTYDVTFDYANLTIRFDTHKDKESLRGGDISELDYVEDLGAKFYDADGTQGDCLDILKANGVNIVRLRLYHTPGNAVRYSDGGYTYTYKVHKDYQDLADILRLAKRAKEHGFKIVLTLHYSDFWTNGTEQFKPQAWQDITDVDVLKDSVYEYTKNVLLAMTNQGTAPDYVCIGNEIQSGILFGYYTADGSYMDSSNGGYCNNMSQLASLLGQGSKAVREVCPNAKIIMHLTLNTSITQSTYEWFFDEMNANGLEYDIIGESYYPYWTNEKPSYMASLAQALYNRYGKESMIMECGYSWTQYRPSGRYWGNYEGQLHMNGTAYNEASPEGQKKFIQDINAICDDPENHILGYLYWDPVMVEQQVNGSWIKTGWVENGANEVGNTTWFDYEGKALPVLEAVAEGFSDGTTDVKAVAHSIDKRSNDDAIYNLAGQRVGKDYRGIIIKNGRKYINK